MAGLTLISAPSYEPITLTEAKDHLRVYSSADDSTITRLISAARARVELFTRRALISQSWRLTLDRFPVIWTPDITRYTNRPAWNMPRQDVQEIHIPKNPVISVDKVSYLTDPDGAEVEITDFQFDLASEPARILPGVNSFWPVARCALNAVKVEFTCGYVNTSDSPVITEVPGDLLSAVYLVLGDLFENRESQDIPKAAENLMLPYRVIAE